MRALVAEPRVREVQRRREHRATDALDGAAFEGELVRPETHPVVVPVELSVAVVAPNRNLKLRRPVGQSVSTGRLKRTLNSMTSPSS